MKRKSIFETPEEISLPNLSYNRYGEPIDYNEKESPWMEDRDAYPFFMMGGDIIIGRRGNIHSMPAADSRNSGYYPGRFWLDRKVISFWEYPDRDTFISIIRKLEDSIGINILDDKSWRVEVPPEPFSKNPWRMDRDFKSYLIPCKEYLINKKEETDMKKYKLVPESLEEILEGVADKYAEKHWGIRDEEEEFNRKYNQANIGEKISSYIIKNPRSLNSFPKGCRGVITRDGDLYVATEDVIHVDILKDLKRFGIISSSPSGWEDITESKDIDFITVQRVWGKDIFAIGESYMLPKSSRDPEGRKKALEFFIPFLERAKNKNPKYKFIDEQIRVVSREILSDEEYEEFKTKGS